MFFFLNPKCPGVFYICMERCHASRECLIAHSPAFHHANVGQASSGMLGYNLFGEDGGEFCAWEGVKFTLSCLEIDPAGARRTKNMSECLVARNGTCSG
ncbi:hypothetical protein CEXT_376271 [Caerostris extrusa]|uniref:Uncharacterized protein n=1 Tax=Caerostris extrusa TaxID=172846 RepID=A0AAV4NH81_CAEEX|nr:hypothetical protein CEXT_376271 [Caerostris extrusa]